jgi:hypothetical protein
LPLLRSGGIDRRRVQRDELTRLESQIDRANRACAPDRHGSGQQQHQRRGGLQRNESRPADRASLRVTSVADGLPPVSRFHSS